MNKALSLTVPGPLRAHPLSHTPTHLPCDADPLVETASLASVSLPPPCFRHGLQDCVHARLLSDAQLETVVYANMRFKGRRLPDGKRPGFFLGDGAPTQLPAPAAALLLPALLLP